MLIKASHFERRTNLFVVQIDSFKLILELEFLRDMKTLVLPYFESLIVIGSKSYVISQRLRMSERNSHQYNSIKALRRIKPHFLYPPIEEDQKGVTRLILKPTKSLTQEFEDNILDEFPRRLPPRRAINHEIERILGTKPLTRTPYHMPQFELNEHRKSLAKMSKKEIIVHVKSSYVAKVLFKKKVDGSLRIYYDY